MPTPIQHAIRCENIHHYLGTGESQVHVLKDVSLELKSGTIYSIMGPSGCGKSTLLYLLGLLDKPTEGRIHVGDIDVTDLDDTDLSYLRNREMGFVFQFHFLLREFTALDNIKVPMRRAGVMSDDEMNERAAHLLDLVGLGNKTHRRPDQLSGGEQQRVAIARSLSHNAASWQERQRGNLQIFQVLRLSASFIVSMVILLSGFGIFNVLSISVIQRTKEIAILRSMGFRKNDIAGIFLWQGVMVAVLGILSGWLFGALLTFLISKVRVNFRGLLRADYFIVEWSFSHYLAAALLAFVTVLIAAYVPARRAARLEPADILRGTGQ
ncbi:MAG: ATP-binding cassette domain-containing protein [Blastochloris sp.]|nr:ATP-binding cassette domain-containing protein [Blastochloris sp.]